VGEEFIISGNYEPAVVPSYTKPPLEHFFSLLQPTALAWPNGGSGLLRDKALRDFPEAQRAAGNRIIVVRHVVRCDEASLRELFTTVLGDEAGYVILDTVRDGGTIVVKMEDGRTVEMATAAQALRIMAEHFAWRPSGIEAMVRQISL
jgi:hypothetical protein